MAGAIRGIPWVVVGTHKDQLLTDADDPATTARKVGIQQQALQELTGPDLVTLFQNYKAGDDAYRRHAVCCTIAFFAGLLLSLCAPTRPDVDSACLKVCLQLFNYLQYGGFKE